MLGAGHFLKLVFKSVPTLIWRAWVPFKLHFRGLAPRLCDTIWMLCLDPFDGLGLGLVLGFRLGLVFGFKLGLAFAFALGLGSGLQMLRAF